MQHWDSEKAFFANWYIGSAPARVINKMDLSKFSMYGEFLPTSLDILEGFHGGLRLA
jgi:hypothetical protein